MPCDFGFAYLQGKSGNCFACRKIGSFALSGKWQENDFRAYGWLILVIRVCLYVRYSLWGLKSLQIAVPLSGYFSIFQAFINYFKVFSS